MNYFEQIQAIHQEVRTFVEAQEPGCKITSIRGSTDTRYTPMPESMYELLADHANFVLFDVQVQFYVEGHYLANHHTLSCEVFIRSDGTLHLARQRIGLTGRM